MGTLDNNFTEGAIAVGRKCTYDSQDVVKMADVRIFISIPITGHILEEVKARAAKFVAKIKRYYEEHEPDTNVEVVVPFDICPDPTLPYEYYMGKDIEALLKCNQIISMQGWPQSRGCLAEYEVSRIYGIAHSEEYQWEKVFKDFGVE